MTHIMFTVKFIVFKLQQDVELCILIIVIVGTVLLTCMIIMLVKKEDRK